MVVILGKTALRSICLNLVLPRKLVGIAALRATAIDFEGELDALIPISSQGGKILQGRALHQLGGEQLSSLAGPRVIADGSASKPSAATCRGTNYFNAVMSRASVATSSARRSQSC